MALILVIDDDVTMREMVAEILMADHEVITACDGEMGVAMALAERPDLIICDLSMPKLDGFAVLQRVQNVEQLSDVPFIFLTAFSDTDTLRAGMALGADDYLTKPFVVDELRKIVAIRLDKRARRKEMVNRAIDELRLNMTASLPHELRTAIMIVQGYAHIVLEEPEKLDPLQRRMIESIRDYSQRLESMSEKYLWYLKTNVVDHLDADEVTPYPNVLIGETAREIAERFNRADDLELYLEPGQVKINQEYLTKIAEELIENAFKFSSKGALVRVYGASQLNEYLIFVCDFGRGMTPDQIERIGGFMQFEREQYEQQGTGLGLIIAKRLTELCGGQLAISSTGRETQVSISLPIATEQSSPDMGAFPKSPYAAQR